MLVQLLFSLWIYHAIYISVLEIERSNDQLLVAVKVFTDDLQNVIRNYNSTTIVQAPTDQFPDLNRQLITQYFNTQLTIELNGDTLVLISDSTRLENDIYWLHFSTDMQAPPVSLRVSAPYFTELFPDQANILSLTMDGETTYHRFSREKPVFAFSPH